MLPNRRQWNENLISLALLPLLMIYNGDFRSRTEAFARRKSNQDAIMPSIIPSHSLNEWFFLISMLNNRKRTEKSRIEFHRFAKHPLSPHSLKARKLWREEENFQMFMLASQS
jgi:hypothetical protein